MRRIHSSPSSARKLLYLVFKLVLRLSLELARHQCS